MADSFLESLMGGYKLGSQIKQDRNQSQLAQLASQAYSAPQDQRQGILAQAVGVDPDAGMALDKSMQGVDDQRTKTLVQAARYLTTAPEAARPGIYQQMKGSLSQFGMQLPDQYDNTVAETAQALVQAYGDPGDDLKSLRVGKNGNYWAIRGGQFVDTGTPAAPSTVVRDQPGVPFDILDKRTGGSIYNQQPQAQQLAPNSAYQTPGGIVRIGDVAPGDMAAVQADISSNGASDNYQLPPRDAGAQDGRPQARPSTPPISDYQQASLGIQRDRMQIAQDARREATAARKVADDVKAEQKRQVDLARQAESATASNTLVSAIDDLTASPGYADLGTELGDLKIATPIMRNDAKDANAKLKNIGGQVALSTMARLKALSSQGATGFGALSAPELTLLQNAIATLNSGDISNAELTKSLKTIRDTVDKVATWEPTEGANAAPAPASGGVLRYNPATGDFE